MLLSVRRPARLQVAWLAFLASLVLLAGLITLLAFDPASWFLPRTKARPLVVFCAAGRITKLACADLGLGPCNPAARGSFAACEDTAPAAALGK